MTFDNKPKKGPPARFANKGKKKEEPAEDPTPGGQENDVEMKDEEVKKPAPKKKASPVKEKPVKAPVDEDMAESIS